MAIATRSCTCGTGEINSICVRCSLGPQLSAGSGVLLPGDLMLISVELIDQIRDEPNPVLVRVNRVSAGIDGTKVLWLERV